jgi:RimJ/RimL family protein N-acetyltransferase
MQVLYFTVELLTINVLLYILERGSKMIKSFIPIRLTDIDDPKIPANVKRDFWNSSFNEEISINGSGYQIAKYEEVNQKNFENAENSEAFYLVSDNNIIIGLGQIEIIEETCQITFFIAENYRQIGIGTELCKLLIQKCWSLQFINEITFKCSDYNIPAEEIAQELGFSFTGYSGVGTECNGIGCQNYSLKRSAKK